METIELVLLEFDLILKVRELTDICIAYLEFYELNVIYPEPYMFWPLEAITSRNRLAWICYQRMEQCYPHTISFPYRPFKSSVLYVYFGKSMLNGDFFTMVYYTHRNIPKWEYYSNFRELLHSLSPKQKQEFYSWQTDIKRNRDAEKIQILI
jgi:hypothetical protein